MAMKNDREIYFSCDIEADGPIPAEYSMLSLGAAAFSEDGKMLDTFSINLKTLDGAKQHPDTMAWWKTQWAAYEESRKNQVDPKAAMFQFSNWIKKTCEKYEGKPVLVGYPAGFDFTFIYWYLVKFTGESVVGFSCLDMKSFVMPVLGVSFRNAVKRVMPKSWFAGGKKHTHIAIDDAIEQGELFMGMLKASKNLVEKSDV